MLLGHLEQQLLMLRSVKRRTRTAAGGSLRQQPWLRVGVGECETMRVAVLKKGNQNLPKLRYLLGSWKNLITKGQFSCRA